MADFQTRVERYPDIGVPGAFASINPVVSTALGRIAGEAVKVGGFCWDDPDHEGIVKASGTGTPLGFVARDIIYPIYDFSGAQDVIATGFNVNVQTRGDFFVHVKDYTEKGKKVFASLKDGSVLAGDAGATVADAVETGWTFAATAEADSTAVITYTGYAVPAVQTTPAGSKKDVEVVTDVNVQDDTVTVTKDTIQV